MNFIEFIGFIVTMIVLFFILLRRSWEERKRRQNPEQYEEQEEDREKALREFLRSLNVEVDDTGTFREETPAPPPPPEPEAPPPKPTRPKRLVRDSYELETGIDEYIKTVGVESRKYETDVGKIEFRELGQDILTEDLFLEPSTGEWGVIGRKGKPRIQKIFDNLKRPGDLVIYREILGKPKALQSHILPHDLAE